MLTRLRGYGGARCIMTTQSTTAASADRARKACLGDELTRWCLAAQAGDQCAEQHLVRRLFPKIERYLKRMTWDKAAVADILQDTFEIAVRKVRSGQPNSPELVQSYVYGIARYVLLDYLRKKQRTDEFNSVDSQEPAALVCDEDPLDWLLQQEMAASVAHAIERLKQQRDRRAINGFYYEERSSAELCSELNLKQDHLYRVLHRARQRIEKNFGAPGNTV